MFDIIDIDELEIPDVIDDEFLDLDIVTPTKFHSYSNSRCIPYKFLKPSHNNSVFSNNNLSFENNHVSVLNSSTFSLSFELMYTFNGENFIVNSGKFLPLYTRQIPVQKESTSLHLIIKSIDSLENETIIYNSSFIINKTYKFIVSGDLNNPNVSEK